MTKCQCSSSVTFPNQAGSLLLTSFLHVFYLGLQPQSSLSDLNFPPQILSIFSSGSSFLSIRLHYLSSHVCFTTSNDVLATCMFLPSVLATCMLSLWFLMFLLRNCSGDGFSRVTLHISATYILATLIFLSATASILYTFTFWSHNNNYTIQTLSFKLSGSYDGSYTYKCIITSALSMA